jgi:CBS domain containing-hemolysin-like protein
VRLAYVFGAIALLIANGFFVAAEFGLVAARRTKLEQARAGSDRAAMALKSMAELPFTLAGAQLGITMCSLGLGYVAEPAVAAFIGRGIDSVADPSPALLHTFSFLLALAIVTFLHMVIGEMAPKNIAIADPEKTALWVALPFRGFVNLLRPFVVLLNALAKGALRVFGVTPAQERTDAHTAEELATMIEESAREGLIAESKQRLLTGAIGLRRRDAGAVMIPRTEMVAAPVTSTPEDVERIVVDSGHSRIPLYAGDADHVVGFFHAKDLLQVPTEGRARSVPPNLIRQMLIVPESRKVQPLLLDMQRKRTHFALVVEEHGGTAGIVSIEDLLEELVGDIRDEHDLGELGVEQLADDRFLVPGTLRVDEVSDRLGIDLPSGEYETIAGFLMDRLGRIPKRRDVVDHGGWRLRVRSMHRRRVVQVLIERARGAVRG